VLWSGLIFLLSTDMFGGGQTGRILLPLLRLLLPGVSEPALLSLHALIRKVAHFGEYLVLGILLFRALHTTSRTIVQTVAAVIVLAALHAAVDELHQSFVPGRTAAVADCLIDVTGAAAGLAITLAWAAIRRPAPSAA